MRSLATIALASALIAVISAQKYPYGEVFVSI